MFENLIRPQGHNSLAADSSADYDMSTSLDGSSYEHLNAFEGGRTVPITPELHAAISQRLGQHLPSSSSVIIPKEAKSVTHIHHLNTAYSTLKRHEGNSGVLFDGIDAPFSIEKILQFPPHPNKQVLQGTWVIACRQQYTQISHDPYMEYPHLGMCMWGCGLEPDMEAMPIERIHAHFAKCVVPWEGKKVTVIISLSRVCCTVTTYKLQKSHVYYDNCIFRCS